MRPQWGRIEYQVLVLAHKDLMKYEAMMGFVAIFYKQDPGIKSTFHLQT